MLTNLLKHELKATSRYLVPLFLILLLFTILNRILLGFDIFNGAFAFISGITMIAYVLSLIALVVVTFVILIIRFYKNLTSEEGYLMFTLPAKASELITSKLLIAILWTVLSCLAIILSLCFLLLKDMDPAVIFEAIRRVWEEVTKEFGGTAILFIIEAIIMGILALINNILQIYVSIAIGQLFNGHKLLGSFGAYIGINIALQIIFTIIVAVIGFVFHSFEDVVNIPTLFFPLIIIVLLILNGVYYGVTNYLFTNKLNLE